MATKTYTSKDEVPMRIWAGVLNTWRLAMFNDDGSVLNATGYVYYCQVRDEPGGNLLAQLAMDLDHVNIGIVTMTLSKTDSVNLGVRSGVYDVLQEETATPTNLTRLYGGTVEIIPVITEV
jgi:hypothetical protein